MYNGLLRECIFLYTAMQTSQLEIIACSVITLLVVHSSQHNICMLHFIVQLIAFLLCAAFIDINVCLHTWLTYMHTWLMLYILSQTLQRNLYKL